MPRKTINLTSEIYEYLVTVSVRHSEILSDLREETLSVGYAAGMQIGPEQGQFVQLFVRLFGAKRTLAVGVFTGYSCSLAVALALPDDGWPGRRVRCER